MVFLFIRLLPGDPISTMFGEKGNQPELRAEFEKQLGMDKPFLVQYFIFLGRVLRGDIGTSIVTGRKVLNEFFSLFPATLELTVSALLFSILLGIPLGILSALYRNSVFDRFVISISLTGYSMSIFWWGLVLILIFSIFLGWTPVSGYISVYYDVPRVTGFMSIDTLLSSEPWGAFYSYLAHLILPTLTLATVPFAFITRITRASLIETLQEDFIRTARSKGVPFKTVIVKHAFRNALLPVVTIIGLMFGALITGAVLTETVFSWPGIGHWMVQGVSARDYPVLQGGVLMIAIFVLITNITVDLICMKLDPRVRKGMS